MFPGAPEERCPGRQRRRAEGRGVAAAGARRGGSAARSGWRRGRFEPGRGSARRPRAGSRCGREAKRLLATGNGPQSRAAEAAGASSLQPPGTGSSSPSPFPGEPCQQPRRQGTSGACAQWFARGEAVAVLVSGVPGDRGTLGRRSLGSRRLSSPLGN